MKALQKCDLEDTLNDDMMHEELVQNILSVSAHTKMRERALKENQVLA